MRNWNGFLAWVAVLLALVVLAGCGGDDDTAPAAGAAEGTATTDTSGPVEAQVTGGETGDATIASSRDRTGTRLGGGGKITGKAKKKGKKGEVSVGAGAACPDVDLAPSDANLPQVEAAILCLVNGERADNGRSAVASNAPLKDASLAHSRDMVSNTFFAHESPSGSTLVSRVEPTGYIPTDGEWVLGENLAYGTGALATPKAIVQGWMDSPGHRENLLNPDFKDVGIGIVTGVPVAGRSGGATYTTDYGAKGTAGGDSGSGGDSGAEASITRDGRSGVAAITASAKRRCARRKLVAKRVRGKVRCVKKTRRRR